MYDLTLTTWLIIIVAILLFAISKGGFMGSFGMLSVPLMSLVISPTLAAALLLPLLICADMVNFTIWRKQMPQGQIIPLCIYATIGVVAATIVARYLSEDILRLIIGIISIIFALNGLFNKGRFSLNFWGRGAAGATSGFTSYMAHAGGPPFIIWAFNQTFTVTQIQALSAIYFTYVNLIKVPGYVINGFFTKEALLISLYVVPIVPIGVLLGRYLHHKVKGQSFYIIVYIGLLIAGIKLCF